MGEYVKVHPELEEKAAADEFKSGGNEWSHVISDSAENRMFFGDYRFISVRFDFDFFQLYARGNNGFHRFTWPQAREFAQAIIGLADKYEGRE